MSKESLDSGAYSKSLPPQYHVVERDKMPSSANWQKWVENEMSNAANVSGFPDMLGPQGQSFSKSKKFDILAPADIGERQLLLDSTEEHSVGADGIESTFGLTVSEFKKGRHSSPNFSLGRPGR